MTPDASDAQRDLRQRLSIILSDQSTIVVADASRFLPLVGAERLGSEDATEISRLMTALLSRAVRDGHVDPLSTLVTELRRILLRCDVSTEYLFGFAYLIERTVLEELSLHAELGATMELWPNVAQLVRRGSFDFLAAMAERARVEPAGGALIDPVTSLYSQALFDTVLGRELDRAGRMGQSVSLVLFVVNDWPSLTGQLEPGVADKVLERTGVLIRGFFRQSDWVARHGDHGFAVLLVGTDVDEADALAQRVRKTVADRLDVTDHRTNQPVKISVNTAIVRRHVPQGQSADAERLMAEAEASLRA